MKRAAVYVLLFLLVGGVAYANINYKPPAGEEDYLTPNPKLTPVSPRHTGYTSIPNPTLWFYCTVPDQPVKLVVAEAQSESKPIFETELKSCSNLCSFELKNVNLKPNVAYEWTLTIVTDPKNSLNNIVGIGAIKYVPLSQNKKPEDYNAYAELGYWYDAANLLNKQLEGEKK